MKVVIDAMGGDQAPGVVVDGVVQAARELDVDIISSTELNSLSSR